MTLSRRTLLQSAAAIATPLALPALAPLAQAQASAASWPAGPIRLLIAFPAGGPTDITMRVLADNVSRIVGQPVVVENRPGAGGTLPAQQLLTAQPDGLVLAQIPLGVFRLPFTTRLSWDPLQDLTYIIGITGYAFGVVVPADSPFKTWADLINFARANPGRLDYGSTRGADQPAPDDGRHRAAAEPAVQPHPVQGQRRPDGRHPRRTDHGRGRFHRLRAARGRAASCACSTPGGRSGWHASRMRRRCREVGVPIVQASPYGLGGPKGMAPALVQRVHDVFKQAMEMPSHVEALARYDQVLMHMSPAEYTTFARETSTRERALVEKLGLLRQN
jgi:tripartite-type tricarboxylate transporter receptor subunit TctC